MTEVKFMVAHNVSSSKGWGRYKAATPAGRLLICSATGNQWVSAPHGGEAETGMRIILTLQTMTRVGKRRQETVKTTDYNLIAQPGATATVGFWSTLEVVVLGARLEEGQKCGSLNICDATA